MDRRKMNIPMLAALILLFLTMITTHMTSDIYARYTANASGSDHARVARFSVGSTMTADENENGKYKLTVTNDSEVAVRYKILVEFTAPMSVALDGGEPRLRPEDETAVTFTNDSWVFEPGNASREHILQFALADWSYITQEVQNIPAYSKTLTFDVKVVAEQID